MQVKNTLIKLIVAAVAIVPAAVAAQTSSINAFSPYTMSVSYTHLQRVSQRIRQLHREATRQEGCPQHLEEHDDHHSRAQHPRFQARQELRSEGEIITDK